MCWHRLGCENLNRIQVATPDVAAKVSAGDLHFCSTSAQKNSLNGILMYHMCGIIFIHCFKGGKLQSYRFAVRISAHTP